MSTRERLAEALRGKQWIRKVMDDGYPSMSQADEFDLADALLPVVERIAAERAAEELRATARRILNTVEPLDSGVDVRMACVNAARARASALTDGTSR